jgi:predicted ATP-grasp superfamily ATP-dependent carboligase
MKKVILIDGQTVQSLPISKSLKKLGYITILLCDKKNSYGYRSRYADRKIISPSVQKDFTKFHGFFTQLIKTERIDVTIPLTDFSARYLSYYSDMLKSFTNFTIPPYDVFMNGYNKSNLMRICRINNFPHPKSQELSFENINEVSNYVGFPALIKPNESSGARGFALVNNKSELIEKLEYIIKNYGSCHMQELIPPGGKQFNIEMFISDRRVINYTILHKIRYYPLKGGSSCFNQTIINDDLVALCASVLNKISWSGFAEIEVIEDPRDKVMKILEINPRVPACIEASFNSGINFTENIVNNSLGLPLTTYTYHPGNYTRYFGLDLLWFIKSKNRFKTKPSWFKTFFNSNHYLQDGSFDDPLPFFFGNFGYFLKQLDPKFRKSKKGMN